MTWAISNGVLTMEFNGEIFKFNIFEAMRYPSNRCDELETPLEALHYAVE